jgi:hypothetical protein
MGYALAEAVWGIMNPKCPSIEDLNNKFEYVREMSDLHDDFLKESTELLEVVKGYLAYMQDLVGEAIRRWQEFFEECLIIYHRVAGQPLPTVLMISCITMSSVYYFTTYMINTVQFI